MGSESVLYIEIDVLCALFIFIMALNLNKTRRNSGENKAFFMGIVSVGFILFTDIIAVVLQGMSGSLIHILLYIVNAAYFISTGVAGFSCLLYVDYIISDDTKSVDGRKIMYNVPCAALTVLTLLSLRFGYLFYIDEANMYHRGSLHVVQQLITMLYFVIALFYAVGSFFTNKNLIKKPVIEKMILFTAISIAGLAVQAALPGAAVIWPSAVIAMFIVFSDIQNSQISLDTLTGLNNRTRLIKYTKERCQRADDSTILTCVVFDIENFKAINDRYGHDKGDEAIVELSTVVKKAVAPLEGSHFLARYTAGGFAIISECEINLKDKLIESLKNELEVLNDSDQNSFQIILTFGQAVFVRNEMDADLFLKAADDDLYKNKALVKAGKKKSVDEDAFRSMRDDS